MRINIGLMPAGTSGLIAFSQYRFRFLNTFGILPSVHTFDSHQSADGRRRPVHGRKP
jgi:hypothetical protein